MHYNIGRRSHSAREGFTLVELMLAMAFVGLLLLAIAYCIIQVSNIYSKGLTLRQVNDAGRAVSDDIKRAISGSSGPAVVTTVAAPHGSGRLCTGEYSYIWNSPDGIAAFIATPSSTPNRYTTGTTPIRLARVPDRDATLCASPLQTIDSATGVVDLLVSDDRALALYDLSVSPIGPSGMTEGLTAYGVEFTIGTSNNGAILAGGCRPPSDAQSDALYCAINQFAFTATKSVR